MDYTPHIGFRAQHCQKKVKLKSVTGDVSGAHASVRVMYSRLRRGISMSDGRKPEERMHERWAESLLDSFP